MRIGLMCGMFAVLLAEGAGMSDGAPGWLFACVGVIGGMALSSKLDAIAQAADRD